jgi:thymidylate synthase (FAD)
VNSDPEFYRFDQFRARPTGSVKQGSGDDMDDDTNQELINMMLSIEHHANQIYKEMLALGTAPEQARAILPQTMMTQWIETGSLAFWGRFCGLRLNGPAQKEIREYAQVISRILFELFPYSWPALLGVEE